MARASFLRSIDSPAVRTQRREPPARVRPNDYIVLTGELERSRRRDRERKRERPERPQFRQENAAEQGTPLHPDFYHVSGTGRPDAPASRRSFGPLPRRGGTTHMDNASRCARANVGFRLSDFNPTFATFG